MANPILIRPWSRLASLRSPSAAESHPKPQLPQPSLKTTNTNSHDTNATVIATNSLPTAPDVHSPIHSQNLKVTTPMILPPAKLKVHPQPVVEVTIEKPSGNGNASLKHVSEETKNQGIDPNESKENEGHGVRVITISGENRGAYMQITQSQKKQPIHKMRNSDGEKVRKLSSPPIRALYGNSNVQCVNNSMLFNTSLSHHELGVHLIVPKQPTSLGLHLKERDKVERN
ncbi:unnamed protein product [Sphenostylis stenocarpa]|uniref:Uncharacterized protein n=1 Tax=Sphenostylis stenocarpa TaxID=92480 RepID=A0AA86SMB5_9FABA|nr:unnamed protein product [Sphenostylis stenocarpa]